MREVVIVISDLYVSEEATEQQCPEGVALSGLEHVARFGTRSTVASGWRPWLASQLGSAKEFASAAPATVAAFALAPRSASQPPLPTVWIATPVHLIAGLTSLHLDRRSLLRLPPEDLTVLESDFQRTFGDSGFVLRPLASGDFLLFGPEVPLVNASEPARSLGGSLADGMHGGGIAPALRRLGAEIEMWLHDHRVNDGRKSRGDLPVTALWLWGAGRSGQTRGVGNAVATTRIFGTDAYLQGLAIHLGANVLPVPPQLTDVFRYPHAQRTVLVIEIAPMLHSNPTWTLFDALMQIDRSFIAPAVTALADKKFERLVVVANDHELTLRARDRFKFWRRPADGLSGLA